MFGDLLGNMQAQQEEMQKKLKEIKLSQAQNGISIDLNAAKEIENIEISPEYLKEDRQEELQDMLIIVLNRAMEKADAEAAKESSAMLNDLLPGGLGGMFGQ